MFDNEIVAPGEKLKRIRKMLHMTQEELAYSICSKNNISLIEKNKQKISVNLAIKFAIKFNEIAKEKRMIDIKLITKDDFTQDENYQANNIFKNNIIKELKGTETIDLFEEKLSKAEKLIEKYNIADNKKIELYKLSANFYYYKHKYSKSNKMCDFGLKICINSENDFEEANLYIYRARNNIVTANYTKALQQLDYAQDINNCINNDEVYEMIVYNKALTYKKLGEYDRALKYLKILKDKYQTNNQNMFLKVKMVYANCLNEKNDFEAAEKEYVEILDNNNEDFIYLAYKNLSELYYNKKDYKSAAVYVKDSLIYNKTNDYIDEILYFAGKVLMHVNEDVEIYFLQALDVCEKNDVENSDLIRKILYELVLIYMKRDDEENMSLMIKKAEELNINYCLIYAELARYYRGRNDEKSKYLDDKLIDKLKQI